MTSEDLHIRPPRKGFTRLSGGGGALSIKWKDAPVGLEVSGEWLGVRKSSNPEWQDIGQIRTDERIETFGITAALACLRELKPGSHVDLTYLGQKRSKKGAPYHDFVVDGGPLADGEPF